MRVSPEKFYLRFFGMNTGRRFLIILTGSLGDLTRGLALAVALKASQSENHITWLVDSTWYDLIKKHPAIDSILVFDRKKPFLGNIKLLSELLRGTFDVSLDLQRHFKSGCCAWLGGAQTRIGFHPKNTKEGNHFFNTVFIDEQNDRTSKLEHYFAFLKCLQMDRPKTVSFGFDTMETPDVNGLLPPCGTMPSIGLVLSSSWESKDWPLSGYHILIKRLLNEQDVRIVLLGGKTDTDAADTLIESMGEDKLINLAGKTSLPELLAIIKECTLCVGPDSGPGHIAAALDVPYVSLFGPTPPERVAPVGNERNVVRAEVPCSPCSRKKCPGLDTLCMRLITPEMVLEKIYPILQANSFYSSNRTH